MTKQAEVDVNPQDPIYLSQSKPGAFRHQVEVNEWSDANLRLAVARGCTVTRCSYSRELDVWVFEGWKTEPLTRGAPRFKQPYAEAEEKIG